MLHSITSTTQRVTASPDQQTIAGIRDINVDSSKNLESVQKSRPKMSAHLSDVEAVQEAAQAVGRVLGDQVYAIVGGAGRALVGSPRTTTDVDIVFPRGQKMEIRKLFKRQEGFVVEERTLHAYFSSNPRVDIEILTPLMFKEAFEASTPTVMIGSAKVLKPALLLNAKCHLITGRGRLRRGVMRMIFRFRCDGSWRAGTFLSLKSALV